MDEISAEARSLALVAAFWALARSLKAVGVVDVAAFFEQARRSFEQLEAEGEEEAAAALQAILGPLHADWVGE